MRPLMIPKMLSFIIAVVICQVTTGQETEVTVAGPLDESGNLVRFERDIAPILRARCLKCHGPDEAKEDFRVDDRETFMEYVEPGDIQASIIYTDFLTADDTDSRMPPHETEGSLSPSELALIRVWIDEGANWPDGFLMTEASTDLVAAEPERPKSIGERIFRAIGYLHPATIHFPVALFSIGSLFVLVGLKWPSLGTQIPMACLFIGTASALASVAMGWSLVSIQGYDTGWEFLDFESQVDAHRWSAVIVTTVACTSSLLALIAILKNSERLQTAWKVGLLACGIGIGLVGHQGGEMTYGRDFYPAMFRVLMGQDEQAEPAAENPMPVAATSKILPNQR